MIDLTPLDIRSKRGDFKKKLGGGYDPAEVDVFLELVAERLEEVVRDNLQFRERSETLQRQVQSQSGREQAVQEALVTAQELRADIRAQAQREADHLIKEAETEGRRMVAEAQAEVRSMVRDAERRLEQGQDALVEMERRRTRFLKEFRQLLEREMDVVIVEEERQPLEDRAIDLDLGGSRFGAGSSALSGGADPRNDSVESVGDASAVATPPPLPEPVEAPALAVDTDPAERPPMDAPVDDLAALYGEEARAPFFDSADPSTGSDENAADRSPPSSEGEALLFSFDSEEGAEGEAPSEDPDSGY